MGMKKKQKQYIVQQPAKDNGGSAETAVSHDLDFFVGTWVKDDVCEDVLEKFRQEKCSLFE